MREMDVCDSCGLHCPVEFTDECARCRAVLCPICDEDGHDCQEREAEPLPLAA